jgi:hypothetical protein
MILERSREWSVTVDLLAGVGDGPRALFVEGDAGIGKTTLFDAAVAEARDRGFRVLRSQPSQSEVRLTHAGIIEILDSPLPGKQADWSDGAIDWSTQPAGGFAEFREARRRLLESLRADSASFRRERSHDACVPSLPRSPAV